MLVNCDIRYMFYRGQLQEKNFYKKCYWLIHIYLINLKKFDNKNMKIMHVNLFSNGTLFNLSS